MSRLILPVALIAASLAAPTATFAQTVPPTTPPAAPGSPQTVPEKSGPTLTDKLDATDGVIKPPPSGDTDMTIPAPNAGSRTPVIPPSAVTPNGAPADGPKPEAK